MAEDSIDDLRKDLPMSMAIAGFTGISWFIGAEITASLFLIFKRRHGLYFWSAALGSWGVILQPLFIVLADFGIWTDLKVSITMIYLTWLIMVVPQSWLLYSRLHLVAPEKTLKWIKFILLFTSIAFSVPTIVIGTIAQATDINPDLFRINLAWDRVQLTVYFVQETALSLLYIWHARKLLRNSSLFSRTHVYPVSTLGLPSTTTTTTTRTRFAPETRQVLRHLVLANIIVIVLDAALLGVQCANLFYLQGAFKPCVYGVKLKVEFAILNRLIGVIRRPHDGGEGQREAAAADSAAEVLRANAFVGAWVQTP
ncbi:2c00c64e-5fed-40bf-b328-66cc6d921471 [Thermothielavioides terrestris]|uniref:2c00c64e-5fed-40bf-b328-66cc6d921471 n=1 Tax=Thermothielavioides terrestris TaxID=2587410 RepID=A0A446BPW6_9PEZI|nr:2c00c64e-5fed-40bf-b328-66cc6d921471 [Thermothielavioides terrestris]